MALSSELRAALASRHRPRLRKQVQELPAGQPGERCSFNEREGTSLPQCSETERKDRNLFPMPSMPAAPPPIPPDWSHLLCGGPHEAASALSASSALLAIGCRLGSNPSPNALCEAANIASGANRV